jgi:hypothetical protein
MPSTPDQPSQRFDFTRTVFAIDKLRAQGEAELTPEEREVILKGAELYKMRRNALDTIKVVFEHLTLTPDERTRMDNVVRATVGRVRDLREDEYQAIRAKDATGKTFEEYRSG